MTPGADEHAMYKRPPVALVVAEARFPGEAGAPLPLAVQRALVDVLGDDWVIDQVQPPIQAHFVLGPGLPQGSSPPPGMVVRFSNRQRTTAIALTSATVTLETTDYGHWPRFRSVLELALASTERLLRPAGATRAGLRYIDEVRVPGIEGPGWSKWLSADLLPPGYSALLQEEVSPIAWNGAAQYAFGSDMTMVLRYGPQPAQPGFAVRPDRPLRRLGPMPTGPFFLLDFDASWEPQTVPEWDTEDLLRVYDLLRRPVRLLFDSVVPGHLVDDVFNKEED